VGWNLQTWLWGTVILCGIVVWVYDSAVVRVEHNKTFMDNPPLEFQVKIFENKIRKLHELRLICGFLAVFCVVTFFLFA
jgi:hypothetical protein